MITRLGLLAFPWADFASSPTDDPDDWELTSTHLPLVRSYGSSVLLWTLFLVGNQELTTRATQKWAAETCAHIGEAMGLRQANVLADILKEKMEIEAREGVVSG
ncbi:hypothetical protein BFW01_g6977 [Lasiodiplodia theobromae]|nr:hypothetical protein BFW01_g6977 [Lasiodiplodia theobromae]